MKKFNNKGMTLVELLISVVLISVIMIFMYQLIDDVRRDKKSSDYLMDNLIKISEIEVAIQNKLINKTIPQININKTSKTINFAFANFSTETSIINFNDTKWTLNGLEVNWDKACYKSDGRNILIKIPLKDKNEKITSLIEIPYYSETDVNVSGGTLGECN